MREFLWTTLAWVLSRRPVADWLIRRAQRTPYSNIVGPDGSAYMDRWWLFNRYDRRPRARWRDLLPSVRVHHIRREDQDRHHHDHPWNARTIILRGHYVEERDGLIWPYVRMRGDTVPLRFGQYHRIASINVSGAWTLFITWRYRGTWGFLVDGRKIPRYEYHDK